VPQPLPRAERANRLVLGGRVEAVEPARVTPGGVPIATFLLAHRSHQCEAGLPREAWLRIRVLAAGDLAPRAAALAVGAEVEVEGFLSRSSYRREPTHLALHAHTLRIVERNEPIHEE